MRRLPLPVVVLVLAGCGRTALFSKWTGDAGDAVTTSDSGSNAADGGSTDGGTTDTDGGATGTDGGTWAQSQCVPRDGGGPELFHDATPSNVADLSMAWDESRHVLVAFGGGATWEFNGAGWRRRVTTVAPSATRELALAWDDVNCKVLLFGGTTAARPEYGWSYWAVPGLDQTWTWDGVEWKQLAPSRAPSPRSSHAMTWDPNRRRVVLFGGLNDDTAAPVLADTWEWDGVTWELRTPTQSPPASATHRMAFDVVTQQVLVAVTGDPTGVAPGNSKGTWVFDGQTWLRVSDDESSPPQCMYRADMVADRARAQLLFLCSTANTMWTWDGRRWTRHDRAMPADFLDNVLGWDGVNQRPLALTNVSWDSPIVNSWEWTGSAWQLQ